MLGWKAKLILPQVLEGWGFRHSQHAQSYFHIWKWVSPGGLCLFHRVPLTLTQLKNFPPGFARITINSPISLWPICTKESLTARANFNLLNCWHEISQEAREQWQGCDPGFLSPPFWVGHMWLHCERQIVTLPEDPRSVPGTHARQLRLSVTPTQQI